MHLRTFTCANACAALCRDRNACADARHGQLLHVYDHDPFCPHRGHAHASAHDRADVYVDAHERVNGFLSHDCVCVRGGARADARVRVCAGVCPS